MIEWILSTFMIVGAALMLLAAIGIIRLPDLPTRMHASTKSGALGTSLIMIAVALAFMDTAVSARAFAIISFIILTAPVAAHVIGRAGYFVGVPLWEGTVKDALKESYDPETHQLHSGLEGKEPRKSVTYGVAESPATKDLEEPEPKKPE
ncbi:monovalent cation/H(+) antiporter subunit G [Marinimicrobium sp. ABcell2]|uniref:monovalent cation/H(+) antiporter subunit G n=1 Tax=Marinimicrobium sp. ABcell2 TaxID=3069751 RepID=UPI0027B4768F|nr:monovalent cation/H(+) antiporter subunit G [Marinimicrobium sp. ABcell2]MDQ2077727.1 monovalent cation/H(+) antiporter subunit G [Marinimicrobium sp. ABcell2]